MGSRSRWHALPADLGTAAALPTGDLVHLVKEYDSRLLGPLDGLARDLLVVDELLFLFLCQNLECVEHAHLAALGLASEDVREHLLDVDVHLLDPLVGDDLDRVAPSLGLDLHHAVVELAGPELLAQLLARPCSRVVRVVDAVALLRRHQDLEQPILGIPLRPLRDHLDLLLSDHFNRHLDEVADHRVDVAAHVADLGELRCLDLHEGRVREAGQPAGDLGLADSGRPHHEDVLGQHLLGHFGIEALAPDSVAQGDCNRPLRVVLGDDVLVELLHDLTRRELVQRRGAGIPRR